MIKNSYWGPHILKGTSPKQTGFLKSGKNFCNWDYQISGISMGVPCTKRLIQKRNHTNFTLNMGTELINEKEHVVIAMN